MMIESAQEALDVGFGTCLVNSCPTLVLFDSRASHSFIAHRFVKEHNIPKCPMEEQMLVDSPYGDMQATLMCPSVRVEIRGGRVFGKFDCAEVFKHRCNSWNGLAKSTKGYYPM